MKRKLRVLLNCTTINKGGGIQSAVSFIRTILARRDDELIDWFLFISPEINAQLSGFQCSILPCKDKVFHASPAKSKKARKELLAWIDRNSIDIVFTYFGPAYVKLPVPHLCGVADGWTTHSTWESFQYIVSWQARLLKVMVSLYRLYWFRQADAWIVEQEAARIGLAKRARVPCDDIHIVSNNCAEHYYCDDEAVLLAPVKQRRILLFASYYPNKNISIVPKVIVELLNIDPDFQFEFILTLPDDDYKKILCQARALGVESWINNIGPVALKDGPALYQACDLLFMPSVLETFSAVYPEAMIKSRPIVTSDKDFARYICGDAARYFDARDPAAAAREIFSVLTNPELRASLVEAGKRRISSFPRPYEKYNLIKQVIMDCVSGADWPQSTSVK